MLFCVFRPALKEVWKSGQANFVLDCSIENLNDILQQAQQVGLLTNQYNYIILNLDLHTIDLGPYLHSETNITGVRRKTIRKYKHTGSVIDEIKP